MIRRPLATALLALLPIAAFAAMDVTAPQPDWVAPGEVRNLLLSIHNTGASTCTTSASRRRRTE